jgi:hypothetical protein
LKRQSHRLELGFDIPGAETDLEASTGGRVHADQVTSQQPGSVERDIERQIADANVRHRSGNGDQGAAGRILLRIHLRHNAIGLSVRLDQIVRAMQFDGSADLEACRMEQVREVR